MNPDTPLPYQRPCASRSTSIPRCTRTGTSWPRSPAAASASTCPTRPSTRGRSTGSEPEQLKVCVEETHRPENVLAAEPYPGAVETIQSWHEQGHFIQITSHRAVDAHPHTEQWLHDIGLPFDELYCSYDKIARCVELEIDVLIDDSPINLERALEVGMTAATLEHPWNRELDGVIIAPDWRDARRPACNPCWHERAPRPARQPRVPARDRAGAPDHRLGPLRARRVVLRQDPLRVPLPLLVPGRGGGDRERPGHRRRTARLQPRRRAAAGRADDRQGDQDRARRARGRSISRSRTSSRATRA